MRTPPISTQPDDHELIEKWQDNLHRTPPNCVFVTQGRRCILKDCCYIADNTVLAPETVVPCFARFAGSPGRFVGELPECTQDLMIEFTRNYHKNFVAKK